MFALLTGLSFRGSGTSSALALTSSLLVFPTSRLCSAFHYSFSFLSTVVLLLWKLCRSQLLCTMLKRSLSLV